MRFCHLLLVAIVCISCSELNRLSPEEFRKYISDPENGLSKEQENNGIVVQVAFKPTDIIAYEEIQNHKTYVSDSVIQAVKRSYDDKAFFVVRFSIDNQEIESQFLQDAPRYANAIQYLNSGIGSRIFITAEDTQPIPLLSHAYVRMYGATGKSSLLLTFDQEDLMKTNHFVLNIEDEMLGAGHLRFPFRKKDIATLPSLNFVKQ